MAQKPKSSAKPKKAVVKKTVKSAPAKKAKVTAKSKPAPIKKKAAATNHKAPPKISIKPAKIKLKTKAKSASNGLIEEQEPQRPLVRLPRDAKTLAFFARQKQ